MKRTFKKTQKHIKQLRLMIVVKNIDAGTGTFVLELAKMNKFFPSEVKLKILVLEKNAYRDIKTTQNITFYHPEHFYPQLYSLSLENIVSFLQEFMWLKNKILSFKPDVVLAVDIHCNLLVQMVKKFFNPSAKTILTTHTFLHKAIAKKGSYILGKVLKLLVNYFYNCADALVGTSQHLSRHLEKEYGLKKKVITIYYGLDSRKVAEKKHNFPKDGAVIYISVARLVEQKDFTSLIKAFSLVRKRLPKSKLWIIGDGPKKKKIEEFVKFYNLEDSIIFYGWVAEVNHYLAKADVFVLSSNWEGFSWALLEALASGLPVISTNTPFGPKEILAGGKYGGLVPMKDVDAFASKMISLGTDEKKYEYYANQSIKRSKFFSVEKMLKSYRDLIVKLTD